MNSTNAPKRLRSAKAPVIRAGVIAANISWKAANSTNGTVGMYVSLGVSPTFMKPTKSRPPMSPSPPTSVPNASEKPTRTQITLTRARPKKLCMIVDSTFLRRTSPP